MGPFLWWRYKNQDRLKKDARAANIDYNAHVSAQWKAVEDKTEWVELAKLDSEDFSEAMDYIRGGVIVEEYEYV
jgi:hypothetical protein